MREEFIQLYHYVKHQLFIGEKEGEEGQGREELTFLSEPERA